MKNLNIKGSIIKHTDIGFDAAIRATSFNQRDYGRRPEAMVIPENVEDIIETIRYAKSAGLKVNICSGGHSWSANHIRNGSLLVNMSKFNQFEVNKESMTATAGPSVGGSDLLIALMKQGLFFPAGHCKGVCIGGYLLQGGFAWNGRKLGMACESVLGLDIVTANGDYVHASATQNADLYWSARGSGGGFFGIVVRYHLRIYKRPLYSGMAMHVFSMKHLEHVYNWAYEVGPSIPKSVEFQMLMSQNTLSYFTPGIEAAAPIFADTKDELHEAMAFLKNSPIKNKAYFKMPFLPISMPLMYQFAMTHYPDNHCWGVDNMWTGADIKDLMPYLKHISETLPPPPAHVLWLNWQPPIQRQDMAFSMEDKIYIALYGAWKSPKDTPQYGHWATDHLNKMAHLGSGIQLADENLHNRTARFVADDHLQKLDAIRAQRDESGLFNAWHSRPKV
jgi:FAD binding domain